MVMCVVLACPLSDQACESDLYALCFEDNVVTLYSLDDVRVLGVTASYVVMADGWIDILSRCDCIDAFTGDVRRVGEEIYAVIEAEAPRDMEESYYMMQGGAYMHVYGGRLDAVDLMNSLILLRHRPLFVTTARACSCLCSGGRQLVYCTASTINGGLIRVEAGYDPLDVVKRIHCFIKENISEISDYYLGFYQADIEQHSEEPGYKDTALGLKHTTICWWKE